MKIGDIIINPHVPKDFNTKPNPLYQSMVIHVGKEYTTTLRYDGKISKYYTKEAKEWEVVRNVNVYEMLKGEKTMQNNEKLTTVQKIKDRNTSEQDAIKILEEHDKMVQAEMANKISEMMKKLKENPLFGLVFGMTLSLSDEHFKEFEEKVKAMQGENK